MSDQKEREARADADAAESARAAAQEAEKKAKVSAAASARAAVLDAPNNASDININKYFSSVKEIIIEALKAYQPIDVNEDFNNKFEKIKKILNAETFQEIKKTYDKDKNKLEDRDEGYLDEIIEKGEEGLKVDIRKMKR